MLRHFNTAGPCKPDLHYMLPPERRLPGVRDLVDQQGYFVLHAPRQVGAWLVCFDQRDGQPPVSERCVVDNVFTPAGRQDTRMLL